jgi:hypothetical protein
MLSRLALGPTQTPIEWVPGALSPEVKPLRCEADHSHQTSAEVKKMCVCKSTPHTPSWRSAELIIYSIYIYILDTIYITSAVGRVPLNEPRINIISTNPNGIY